MNKTAAALATAAILALTGCSATAAGKTAPVTSVAAPTPAQKPAETVKVASGQLKDIPYLGKVFRVSYSLWNNTTVTTDFLITFEYLDGSGTRIGQNTDSVQSLAARQSAKMSMDDYGYGGYKLTDIKSVRVASVKSWPSA